MVKVKKPSGLITDRFTMDNGESKKPLRSDRPPNPPTRSTTVYAHI